ncbi:MAG TPA: NAD(P)-binding domain-containing protein [Hyphomicrobium sp.]|nr:NAD(P)-binding domain-containing protein [Hyphomicrobium sp.]
MNEGTTSSRPGSARPLGLITNDPAALPIAERLAAAGRRVICLQLQPAPRRAHSSPLLEAAANVADIARQCDTVAIAIDDMPVLREILLGDEDRGSLAAELPSGSCLIDFGMHPPRELQSILGLVGIRGIGVVDAAVLGGADALAQGSAKVLAGGFPDAVDAVMPVLCELGIVERTGPLGSAQTAAALMGYVEAAHFAARTEAISVGAQLGIKSSSLNRIFDEAPEAENVILFQRRAEFARRLAHGRGLDGEVISFLRLRPAAPPNESR